MEYTRGMVSVAIYRRDGEPFRFDDEQGNYAGSQALASIERGERIAINLNGVVEYIPFESIDHVVVRSNEATIDKPSPYGCDADGGNDNIIYSNPLGYQPTSTQSGIWWYDISGLKFTPLQVGDKLFATMTNGESYGITVTSATDSSWRAKQDGYTGSASTSMTSSGNLSVAIKVVEGNVLGLTKLEIVE